jgi:hypothetical protein
MTSGRAIQSALDIGHGTVRVVIAERVEDEKIRLLGAGMASSKGLSRGMPLAVKPMVLAVPPPRSAQALKLMRSIWASPARSWAPAPTRPTCW